MSQEPNKDREELIKKLSSVGYDAYALGIRFDLAADMVARERSIRAEYESKIAEMCRVLRDIKEHGGNTDEIWLAIDKALEIGGKK
jgi:hypothetical protein